MGDDIGDGPKMVDVDLFGKTYPMTEENAKTAMAGRDAQVAQYNELKSSNEAREAAAQQLEDTAARAEEKRIKDEAVSAGNIDQLNAMHAADISKRDSRLKKLMISQAIGQHEGIARTALPDMAASLSTDDSVYLTEDETLLVKKADGSSQPFKDYLSGWLVERPHYTMQKGAPPSGSSNEDPKDSSIETMKLDEYNKLSGLKAQEVAGQLAKGTLKIID